jgi:hypothetical protein
MIKDKEQTELATVPPTDGGTIAAAHLELFGPPPLLDGESQEVYDTLLARVTGTVNPKDIIEEIWVHDIVNLVWEILRLRRLKVALLSSSVGRGLHKLCDHRGEYAIGSLITKWSAGEPAAVKRVEKFLKDHGLTMDSVMAHSFVACLDEIERIDIAISRAPRLGGMQLSARSNGGDPFSVKRCSERCSRLNTMLSFPSKVLDDQHAQGWDQSNQRAG